jgi:hypothetical protein
MEGNKMLIIYTNDITHLFVYCWFFYMRLNIENDVGAWF